MTQQKLLRALPPPPETRAVPIAETLHGVTLTDPYRWLEDGEASEVRQWVERQNEYTATILDAVPGREELRERLTELLAMGFVGSPSLRGPYSFFMKRQGTQNQPILYVREGLDGTARPLVDPNPLSEDGTVTVDWWYPSEDGHLVAYGLSSAGNEKSTLHVVNVASGERLGDTIPNTRYSSVAWLPDRSGFYYTRYPDPGSVPPGEENYHKRVFFHRLGEDPNGDPEVFGAGRDPQDLYGVSLSPDGRYLLVTAFQGWSKTELHLRDLEGDDRFIPIARGTEAIYEGRILGDRLYVFTNEGSPNYRLFVTDVSSPGRERWSEVIPESETVLQHVEHAGGKLVALGLRNAASVVQVYSAEGTPEHEIPLPVLGTVSAVEGLPERDELLFTFTSFFVPPAIYRYNLASRDVGVFEQVEAEIDTEAFEARQAWYTSRDGTQVSMFVVHRRGLELNSNNPTVLYGYGGFNISLTPEFRPVVYQWLERGGVYAVPNLRGGGEYGEAWHQAGRLGRKQNVFDDFIAAAEWLVANGYTRPERLAIWGGSNGGLLVGAALTQRPDFFKAVVCQVPLLDMLRYHHFLIARLWIPEYGSADDPEQFRWLHAYSPYHQVRPGVRYPAVLLTTAESDSRVDPLHARKMAALLQEVTDGENPVLLRVETRAGHGAGKPVAKVVDEQVDVWSFVAWQLGVQTGS
ncbi:MAG: prolyl oligopeptidase family serine peptidase [Chloroflexota bacterium]|nr:prolyl oligopeptidase family serine peptidase [Chloroflexota bacterium]